MRVILNILVKEMRELLTLQTLAPLLAMMVIFVIIGRAIRGEQAKARQPQTVIVADRDKSALSRVIIETFQAENLLVTRAEGDRDILLEEARGGGISWLIVIPESLSERVSIHKPVEIELYNIVRGFSFTSAMKGLEVKLLLDKVNARIARDYLHRAYPDADPVNIQKPVRPKEFVMVKGKLAEGNANALQSLVFSQTFMIPIVLVMIIIYASQMIAASIGQEKENKTLETLLTVPINRVSIVIGKMLGAAVVALIVAGIFMGAMIYYMTSFATEMPSAGGTGAAVLGELDIGLTLQSYVLVGVALFLAVLCALSLSTLLAIFADDAKSAQMAITPLMMLVMIPYFFTIFFDIEAASLPVKLLVYAIPFAYPFLTPKAVFFGNYGVVFAGYAYMALFATVCILVAARIFSTDRILTAKLRFGKKSAKAGS